jgi:hypothetical protein
MGLISGATIISSISLFHITLAFFFLTSPSSIADQSLVFIIGEAMGMARLSLPRLESLQISTANIFRQPYTRAFADKSQPLAFLAAALFVAGITDLVSVSLPDEISQYHWGAQGSSPPSRHLSYTS